MKKLFAAFALSATAAQGFAADVAASAPAAIVAAVPAAIVDTVNKGDNAWMFVATALVILMSIPGLALFYGGLVRSKNMLSVLMQVFSVFGRRSWASGRLSYPHLL